MNGRPGVAAFCCVASLAGCLADGDGSGDSAGALVATNDTATTTRNAPVEIDVLANDTGSTSGPVTVQIIADPARGQADVRPGNLIRYIPGDDFTGTDSFHYRVRNDAGNLATASVTVDVVCSPCAEGIGVVYSWDPVDGPLTGYRVYKGPASQDADLMVASIPVGAAGFDSGAPSVTYDAGAELGLDRGQAVCLRVRAYNDAGESAFSSGACGIVPQ